MTQYILGVLMFLILDLSSGNNTLAQEENATGQGLQVGIKSHFFSPFSANRTLPWYKSLEVRYVKPEVRWAIGYQYFSVLNNREILPQGFYGEADFLAIDFSDDLRMGFPLRFYALHDHASFQNTFSGVFSVGSNLHYRIHKHWEIGLELGYIGYGRTTSNENGKSEGFGFIDGTGISIYYAF